MFGSRLIRIQQLQSEVISKSVKGKSARVGIANLMQHFFAITSDTPLPASQGLALADTQNRS